MAAPSLPLNVRRVRTGNLIINRLHMLFNGVAILAVLYYRATAFLRIIETRETPLVPFLVVVFAEIVLTFLWVLYQAYRWRPVKRYVYPERLPEDERLPAVDVFICTADPSKEPSIGVMNTVLSAMSLDYPPDKLAVYLSDDGGSYVTLAAMREAWKFARFWVPFCRKYEVKIRYPDTYFTAAESADQKFVGNTEFQAEKKIIQEKYKELEEALERNSVNAKASVSRDHPPTIEVMTDDNKELNLKEMPLLVYVSREKRPGHSHHFKGGALNVLLRVSAVITNAPYFLVLDCDMYCNDPTSARQAMCFYLDPELSPQIAWVQYPQKFRDVREHDIYSGKLNAIWRLGLGLDGLRGPSIYGCNFFMTREAIYATDRKQKDIDVNLLKKTFGSSNEFIRSININHRPDFPDDRRASDALQKELQLLASCTYDEGTLWGVEAGYQYFTVVEDSITSLLLHCKGWISVYNDPDKPCFLGSSPANLNDMLVQQTRWSFGLMQIGLSKFSPLIYGPPRMSILQSMCYGVLILEAFYVFPFYILAIIPAIGLVAGIPLFPKVSDPVFIAYAFIFLSSQLKHVYEVISYGGDTLMTSLYELRVWMMKCGTCYFYATLNAALDRLGLHEASFTLTNKAIDEEQARRQQLGIYDFQASPGILIPLCSLYIINLVAFLAGIIRIYQKGDDLFAQAVLVAFGVITNYHLLDGMFLRNDSGRISPSVTLRSALITAVILGGGFILFWV